METFSKLLATFAPDQGGVIWIHVLVWFAVAGDHIHLRSRRNLALLLMSIPALLLVDIMHWEPMLDDPHWGWVLGAVFTGIFVTTAFMAVWATRLARRDADGAWPITLPTGGLVALLALVFAIDCTVVLGKRPEDAGYFTSLGTRRWLETGTMPYGDPLLRGADSPCQGAGAAYGPLLYTAHVPFHFLTGAKSNPPDADPKSDDYIRPPNLATKLTTLSFHVVGLLGLLAFVRRHAGVRVALATATVYCSSAYVLGVGSDDGLIGGITFISHIAPVGFALLTLASLHRPALAGVLLACAVSLLFYPVFFFLPVLGWYYWRGRKDAVQFLAGWTAMGLFVMTMVILLTDRIGDQGPISLFWTATVGAQEDPTTNQYGSSLFGFWGTHPDLAAIFHEPLVGGSNLLRLTFLVVAGFSVATFFLARGRSAPQLALLLAAMAAVVQLWRTHGGGTYVNWYFSLLLVGMMARRGKSDESR